MDQSKNKKSPMNKRLLPPFAAAQFVLFLILLICVLSILGYWSAALLRIEAQGASHEASIELLAQKISHTIDERLKILNELAKNKITIAALNPDTTENSQQVQALIDTANSLARTSYVYIMNSSGTTLYSAHFGEISNVGYNYAFRPYFQNAMESQVAVYPAVGAISKKRGIHLSAPIYNDIAEIPIGVVAIKIEIGEIENLLSQSEDRVALVSPDGIIFSSNQPEWLYKSIHPISDDTNKRLKQTRQFGDINIVPLGVDMEKKDFHLASIPLAISKWKVISYQRKNSGLPLSSSHIYLLEIILGVTFSLALLIFFLTANVYRRKKIEIMLRLAEEKYRSIFKNAVMGIFQTTKDGHFLEISPSMANILGYDSPEQLILSVKNIGDEVYSNPEDREIFIHKLAEDSQVKGFETQFRRKDGSVIWVSLSGRMAYNQSTKEPFLEGFCLDITQRKVALEALWRERDIFSRVTETSPVGIALMDTQGNINYANSQAEKILRITRNNLSSPSYQTPEFIVANLNGVPLAEEQLPTTRVLATDQVLRDERCALKWADGTQILLSISIAPIHNEAGEISEIVLIYEDITEKVRAEKEAVAQRQQLLQADRLISMGILTSGVAHEINNPNTFILSNIQLLSNSWKEAKVILDEYFRENGDFIIGGLPYSTFQEKLPTLCARIMDGSMRIKRIVKELLVFSRSEPIDLIEIVDVNKVIHTVEILLSSMIMKSTHSFVLNLDPEIPPIKGNFQRLEQVLVNIIQNACQALPDQEKSICISTSYDSETHSVIIICRDEGVGIEERDIEHVLDPFFTTKRDLGGTGLGLSISASIVQGLNGTLEFSSTAYKGTTVTLRFPDKDSGKNRE